MSMSKYRDLFISESRRHIEVISELIVGLENNSGDQNSIHELFRHAHSLKGMAATMQYNRISELAHRMEDLLSRVRGGEFSFSQKTADLLLEGNDLLSVMVSAIEAGDDSWLPDSTGLVGRLTAYVPDQVPPTASDEVEPQLAPSQQHQFRQSDTFKTVRIRTEILDRLVNITGELITTRYQLADRLRDTAGSGPEEQLGRLSSLLRELKDEVFLARMLPFALVAERLPRLVRDLTHAQGKQATLAIEGQEIELDRGILEDIAEPLVHILRNAVDHGLEMPADRALAGKTPIGLIRIRVVRDKNHVTIAISDDGRGMDPHLLTARAVEKGLISSQQASAMSTEEALLLVCQPGFSTAESVSDISGRGVGMDAVKSSVHNLGGTLSIESALGQGSRFLLKLPLTVSIIQALLVECGQLTLAFPVNAVDRTLELTAGDFFEEGGQRACLLDGRTIPIRSLNQILAQPLPKGSSLHIPVIVSGIGGTPFGLTCDRITGQREIFVKSLGRPLARLRNATGGAIMGNGSIVFTMDINTFR
jgi:two-component system chemotaxis sensor kinase CheA